MRRREDELWDTLWARRCGPADFERWLEYLLRIYVDSARRCFKIRIARTHHLVGTGNFEKQTTPTLKKNHVETMCTLRQIQKLIDEVGLRCELLAAAIIIERNFNTVDSRKWPDETENALDLSHSIADGQFGSDYSMDFSLNCTIVVIERPWRISLSTTTANTIWILFTGGDDFLAWLNGWLHRATRWGEDDL